MENIDAVVKELQQAPSVPNLQKLFQFINEPQLYKYNDLMLFLFIQIYETTPLALEAAYFLQKAYQHPSEELIFASKFRNLVKNFVININESRFEVNALSQESGMDLLIQVFILVQNIWQVEELQLEQFLQFMFHYMTLKQTDIASGATKMLCEMLLAPSKDYQSEIFDKVQSLMCSQNEQIQMCILHALSLVSVKNVFWQQLDTEQICQCVSQLSTADVSLNNDISMQQLFKYLINLSTNEKTLVKLAQTSFVYTISDNIKQFYKFNGISKAAVYILANISMTEYGSYCISKNIRCLKELLNFVNQGKFLFDIVDIFTSLYYYQKYKVNQQEVEVFSNAYVVLKRNRQLQTMQKMVMMFQLMCQVDGDEMASLLYSAGVLDLINDSKMIGAQEVNTAIYSVINK